MTIPFLPLAGAALRRTSAVLLACMAAAANAQSTASGWNFGAVLDASASSQALALGQRGKGLGLGHSDLNASGLIGQAWQGQANVAAHVRDRHLEVELEEAWVQTRALPAGLQLRAGRFASQLGYLNEQHPHTDDFTERPLLHRAFFGSHWTDDGVRLNWTAPTDLYLRLGLEAFGGRQLVEESTATRQPGVIVLSSRAGGDWGASQSWQAGLSLLHNRREAVQEDHHGADPEHAHGVRFSGRRMWLADLAWKWAPQGNNRQEQLRVTYEHALISGLGSPAAPGDQHQAAYLGAVWRFDPAWETGVRTDLLRVHQLHIGDFELGRLRESSWMFAYKPSHAQTLRLQFTRQYNGGGFDTATHAVQLQYILNLGAHAAHAF